MNTETEGQSQEIVRIELPFNTAIVRAARQNFDRDVRNGNASTVEWSDIQEEYISEARALLLRDGENMIPEPPDYEHIVLSKTKR